MPSRYKIKSAVNTLQQVLETASSGVDIMLLNLLFEDCFSSKLDREKLSDILSLYNFASANANIEKGMEKVVNSISRTDKGHELKSLWLEYKNASSEEGKVANDLVGILELLKQKSYCEDCISIIKGDMFTHEGKHIFGEINHNKAIVFNKSFPKVETYTSSFKLS